MIESGLPPSFWAEAVATANHIRNRCPSRSIEGKTPFELWNGRKPYVGYFRTFGCKAFTLNRTPGKGKFEPLSQKCIFVGYSELSKAYRVWIPATKKIDVTRDLKFVDEPQVQGPYEDFITEDSLEKEKVSISESKPSDEIDNVQIPLKSIETMDQLDILHQENKLEAADLSDKDVFEDASSDAPIAIRDAPVLKRGSGRPRLIRTGPRGRPRKEYHMNLQDVDEPEDNAEYAGIAEVSFEEALTGPESKEWKGSIQEEFHSIVKNDTWEIVSRPSNKSVIGCRIVLRSKPGADGKPEKKKARLVAKGYTQKPGVDFRETFSPVARLGSIRLVIALAAELGLIVHQMDVATAFLNGILEEQLYMELPDLLEESLGRISQDKEDGKQTNLKARKMLQDL